LIQLRIGPEDFLNRIKGRKKKQTGFPAVFYYHVHAFSTFYEMAESLLMLHESAA
jgi:hypothetical protein